MYGWQSPSDMALDVAANWWMYADPTYGARYLVSRQDLQRADVQAYTTDRGPPVAVFPCANGLALYAFR